jgi:hypothetical protein
MARGRPKSKPETGEIRMSDSLPKVINLVATLNKTNKPGDGQSTYQDINWILDSHWKEGYRLHTVYVVSDAVDSIVILYVMQMKDEVVAEKVKALKDAILPDNVSEPVK